MQPTSFNDRRARLLRRVLLAAFVLFFVAVAFLFSGAILPFILALFIAYIFAPAVSWLSTPRKGSRVRLPRWGAVLVIYGAFFGMVGLFSAVALPTLAYEFASLPRAAASAAQDLQAQLQVEWLPALKEQIRAYLPSPEEPPEQPSSNPILPERPIARLIPGPEGTAELDLSAITFEVEPLEDGRMRIRAASPKPPPDIPPDPADAVIAGLQKSLEEAPAHLGAVVGEVLDLVQRVVSGIVSALVTLVLMFMVAAFILIDLDRIHAFVRSLVPLRYREDYDSLVTQLDRGLSGVIRGQFIICLINGVLSGIGFVILGVKFALILAVFAGVMSLIPIFGTVLSSIPAIGIALAQAPSGADDYSGIVRGALVLGWILLIHFIEANFLNPKIIGTSAKIHPALVVLVLVVGEHAFGLVGALLAVPVFSILQTIFLYLRSRTDLDKIDRSAEYPSVEP